MTVDYLRSSLFGFPLRSSKNRKHIHVNPIVRSNLETRVFVDFLRARWNQKSRGGIRFSRFSERNLEVLSGNSGSRRFFRVNCVNEHFSRSKGLVGYFVPLWKEGLFLVRCSVFVAVISAIGMLVWYGQVRARSFIEAQLLPSVCSILSEYLHRELDFGKVRSLSPLGISLQSCSIGPHEEEFSCSEVPTMKIRVRPFASLRRGKIVIDAVLSGPSVLITQKEDFTWLGIPSHSESGLQRHLSTEEGIDYRTKTRRVAREEAAARWAVERSEKARQAAEMGYVVTQHDLNSVGNDDSKDGDGHSAEFPATGSFFCMDERMHWRDHHCMDMGFEYGLKHADLEKSFGAKIPSRGLSFWSRILSSPVRHSLKRKARKKEIADARVSIKRRNLERSAAAALAYFQGLDGGKFSETHTQHGRPSTLSSDAVHVERVVVMDEKASNINPTVMDKGFEGVHHEEEGGHVKEAPIERGIGHYSSNLDMHFLDKTENNMELKGDSESKPSTEDKPIVGQTDRFSFIHAPFLMAVRELGRVKVSNENSPSRDSLNEVKETNASNLSIEELKQIQAVDSHVDSEASCHALPDPTLGSLKGRSEGSRGHKSQGVSFARFGLCVEMHQSISFWPVSVKIGLSCLSEITKSLSDYLAVHTQKLKSYMGIQIDDLAPELAEGVDIHIESIVKVLPVTLDSVYFTGGTLMLLGYGDREPREMENVNGHVKFQNHYARVHVQLSGSCKGWRSEGTSIDGGWLSTDVFVDSVEQKWHANLKFANLFGPLFERILDIPIMWCKGRASGEVHVCMSRGETFPNLHGQLDVTGLDFQIYEAPSYFKEITASLCFRGQRIFLHNASGWFGDAPLEASGDFGLNPEDGEFHLMCQVPYVEVNALMKTFRMKPLLFPVAGSITAVFNCQGPLDAPIFVGSGMVSRKTANAVMEFPTSSASEAVIRNKDAGAVAAFDRIPFSYVSANFTFNTDNSVADFYGIRVSLLDGGEIRGAGNAWICPEGEVDDSAMDVNLSGQFSFDKVMYRYLPCEIQLPSLKIGELNGETKLSGSLLRPRLDIKWAAPKAEESFSDARGDIIISHEYITVNSSSVAFDLYTKVQTSYPDEYWVGIKDGDVRRTVPLIIDGVELDLRMRGFEFFSLISSNTSDSPRPMHLKATGKIKFQGKVVKPIRITDDKVVRDEKNMDRQVIDNEKTTLVGDISLSGIKLNQLMLAPQLVGSLSISEENMKLDATGRPDENLTVEVIGPLRPTTGENLQKSTISVSLQKGQLRANVYYQPKCSANLEVRYLPLDELELASLRGTIHKAELQLNFQKRRGHGILSVLRPKFSGVLGEALGVDARWSGDVITVEKAVLEQAISRYELQGEYVLPGSRDRYPADKERDGLLKRAMAGHLGSVISSMGRWRMRLEVPSAEASEMLPLARLLSRSTDPAVRSRSKDLFIQSLHSVGFYTESLRDLLEAIRGHYIPSDEVILEEMTLPGLAELKGRWRGSLDASGGGNGDTMAEFDFHGEDWEWGTYKTQRVLAAGAYSNNNGLRLEKMFIQKDNATLHADGTLLGPKTNLHFAVLNFPVGLIPTLVQVLESSTVDAVHPLRQLLTPIKGILHMEGDLRGSLAKPECDVQVRLLDGAVGGIDLGRAEIVASITSTSRFLFNANFEPVIQSGHVHVQGSIPVTSIQKESLEEEDKERETSSAIWVPGQGKNVRGSNDETSEKKVSRERVEQGWDVQLAESLKGLNWNILDVGEVRIDADIKDGGMMLITALCPYADWLHGNADIILQVRGTVEQPVVDGSASFHRASISSPVLRKPLTNVGGTVLVKSNRLCISSLESRVSRKGKLFLKGNLPLKTSESFPGDKIDMKCEVLEVRAKNVLSGQVDTQIQITGSMLQPNVSGMIKLSHGEAYLPHDKGNGATTNRLASTRSSLPTGAYNRMATSGHVSPYFGSERASSSTKFPQPSGKHTEIEMKMEQESTKPSIDVRLTDLKLLLGPELRIVYPLILNFAVSGELELNGVAHPKLIKPKGILTFENGDVNLVATQVRLKRDHLNVAKFEPDLGLDPTLDLALVGSEWQFRIQSRASNWQDNLVVTSTRSVEQNVLSPTEAARVFESQLAGSLLEGDGQLAFKKLATSTLESLMPRIEGKGEFGQARWRVVYAPQIPSLLSVDPTIDPLKSLANNISFGTEVEVQLGKRLQASIVRQMKDSEMAMQCTLIYQLTSRLRVLFQSIPSSDSKRLLFEYSATSQD
ncbi:protein TIC236, chloroplastic-like [Tasmannia lanceolata]|uniref:protein TIC236, chloroplastic-like n=1 Tax=Tasmannia lanceolata TaxID=3420 RepID=UPI0040635273